MYQNEPCDLFSINFDSRFIYYIYLSDLRRKYLDISQIFEKLVIKLQLRIESPYRRHKGRKKR